MNVNHIFTGPNPFATGFSFTQNTHQNREADAFNIYKKMEAAAYNFHSQKDYGLNELSKEDLLHLDQGIFSAKMDQDRITMLNKMGITEELLDRVSAGLKTMYDSSMAYSQQLQEFSNGLAAMDASIATLEAKLSGKITWDPGETKESLSEQLGQARTGREDFICSQMESLIPAAQNAEITIRGAMSDLQEDGDIWSLLNSDSSEDVKKAIDYLSGENYGMVMNPEGDVYEEIDASFRGANSVIDSVFNLSQLVNKYRKKLGLDPDNSIQAAAPHDSSFQDNLNRFYLMHSQMLLHAVDMEEPADAGFQRRG